MTVVARSGKRDWRRNEGEKVSVVVEVFGGGDDIPKGVFGICLANEDMVVRNTS
jgi:hypothetical protein